MKPPKCKTCGIAEWRHVCGGADSDRVIKEARTNSGKPGVAQTGRASAGSGGSAVQISPPGSDLEGPNRPEVKRGVHPTPIAPKPEIATGIKFDRTAYQREYMRRYRARKAKGKN